MKVAITGANGFLAGYLFNLLKEKGVEVALLSRTAGQLNGNNYLTTDYTYSSLEEILSDDVDAIAHLAGTRRVFASIADYSSQMAMTDNLYAAAEENNITNIVYASSISVYSGTELPFSESQLPNPTSRYGVYKLTCEQIGNIYSKRGMRIKNLRFAHIYGANEKNDYMVNRFLRRAFAHEMLHVSDNSGRREMLYAKDAAKAIYLALNESRLSGTFNVGSGEAMTNSEIAEAISTVMSPDLPIAVDLVSPEIPSSYMEEALARRTFNYLPDYRMREAVVEIRKEMIRKM